MVGYVSEAVIRRLPGYYRHLKELEAEGVTQISSSELGERMELTASQIRQDINCFGGFGRQGFGYAVTDLRQHIERILGVDRQNTMVIIGAGNIGRAIACADSFVENGFITQAIFDKDPQKIGAKVGHLQVQPMENIGRFLASNKVDICVLAVSSDAAQSLADEMYGLGLCAFWNFVPVDLKLPKDAVTYNVHLDEGLQILSFRMLQMIGK